MLSVSSSFKTSLGLWSLLLVLLIFPALQGGTFEDLSGRATAAREANQLPEAIQAYREALKLNPGWQEGWWYLGTILYDTKEYPGCREALGHVVELNPSMGLAFGLLALCEFQTADYAPSLAHIQKSLAAGAATQPDLERVLRFHEAVLTAHAGDFDGAVKKYVWFIHNGTASPELRTALGLAVLHSSLLPKEIAEDQKDLFATAGAAAASVMAGENGTAERTLQDLLSRYPTTAYVHYLYGCFLLGARPDEAISQLKRELEITPASSSTQTMLALGLLTEGEFKAALPYAKKAAEAEPSSPSAQFALGRALVETGKAEAGIKNLQLAIQLDPAILEYHIALASGYARAGRSTEARRERLKSVALAKELGPIAQP